MASAVATKLILSEYPAERVVIVELLAEEHPDNQRFLADCQKWFGHPVQQFRDEKYGSSWRRKFGGGKGFWLRNVGRFLCSVHLKCEVLDAHSIPSDIFVLGYTIEEERRVDRFIAANNGRKVLTPLIDRGLGKADCLAIIERAGIVLPAMYLLGYNNNNCIGCCKGGEGYWNKIRKDFPATFIAVADIQKAIGPASYTFRDRKTGERFGLDQLPEGKGRHDEPEIECSLFCLAAEEEMEEKTV